MRRSVGERVRARHALETLRAACDSAELAIDAHEVPPGKEIAQTLVSSAHSLAMNLVAVDAYQRAEEDLVEVTDEQLRIARFGRKG